MPQVVEAECRREPDRPDGGLEVAGHELGLAQRPTQQGGEHQLVRTMGPAREIGAKLVTEEPRQPHGVGLVGLDASPLQPAGDLRGRLGHPNRAPQQADAPDPQRDQLARPEAGRRSSARTPAATLSAWPTPAASANSPAASTPLSPPSPCYMCPKCPIRRSAGVKRLRQRMHECPKPRAAPARNGTTGHLGHRQRWDTPDPDPDDPGR